MLNKKYYEKMTKSEADQVKRLREIIHKSNIPPKKVDDNLLVATFNIREFGNKRRAGFAINALAEICNNFDVVAIQELRSNLGDLRRLLRVLGPYWKVVFNDPAGDPRNKGNDERFCYLYDTRTVRFTGMAAELLVSDDFLTPKGLPKSDASVPWRTPFMASLRAGHFDFMLLTVHIQWNKKGGIKARAKEIEMITGWIDRRQQEAKLYDPDVFVLGDFNIPGLKSATFKALAKFGLAVPTALQTMHTDLGQVNHYDQIAYYEENTDCEIGAAGTINFYDAFFKGLSEKKQDVMTYQLSDHLPLWVEFKIRETDLDQFIKQ